MRQNPLRQVDTLAGDTVWRPQNLQMLQTRIEAICSDVVVHARWQQRCMLWQCVWPTTRLETRTKECILHASRRA
jgi:hypothetical protein